MDLNNLNIRMKPLFDSSSEDIFNIILDGMIHFEKQNLKCGAIVMSSDVWLTLCLLENSGDVFTSEYLTKLNKNGLIGYYGDILVFVNNKKESSVVSFYNKTPNSLKIISDIENEKISNFIEKYKLFEANSFSEDIAQREDNSELEKILGSEYVPRYVLERTKEGLDNLYLLKATDSFNDVPEMWHKKCLVGTRIAETKHYNLEYFYPDEYLKLYKILKQPGWAISTKDDLLMNIISFIEEYKIGNTVNVPYTHIIDGTKKFTKKQKEIGNITNLHIKFKTSENSFISLRIETLLKRYLENLDFSLRDVGLVSNSVDSNKYDTLLYGTLASMFMYSAIAEHKKLKSESLLLSEKA